MAFSVANTPSLKGKTALVTGGNVGLGLATVKALSSKGAHVLLAARNPLKGEAAVNEVRKEIPEASVEFVKLDLASQRNIKEAAGEVSQKFSKLDFLINNAGLMAMPEMKTEDGYEVQFGVNHLGHWSLTALLIDQLLAAPTARIVTVTSSAHHLIWNVDFKDPHMRKKYSPWNAYSQSKLANYYFALGLHQEFTEKSKNAMSLLAHPGLSHTNLQVETYEKGAAGWVGTVSKYLAAKVGMEPEQGALPQIRAALDVKAKSGEFYAPRFLSNGAPVKRPFLRLNNGRNVEKLWQLSEAETGISIRI
jgi:NAD(P)-dependent dehydrogenase (short-subunit alcohol dehydrogenase family)